MLNPFQNCLPCFFPHHTELPDNDNANKQSNKTDPPTPPKFDKIRTNLPGIYHPKAIVSEQYKDLRIPLPSYYHRYKDGVIPLYSWYQVMEAIQCIRVETDLLLSSFAPKAIPEELPRDLFELEDLTNINFSLHDVSQLEIGFIQRVAMALRFIPQQEINIKNRTDFFHLVDTLVERMIAPLQDLLTNCQSDTEIYHIGMAFNEATKNAFRPHEFQKSRHEKDHQKIAALVYNIMDRVSLKIADLVIAETTKNADTPPDTTTEEANPLPAIANDKPLSVITITRQVIDYLSDSSICDPPTQLKAQIDQLYFEHLGRNRYSAENSSAAQLVKTEESVLYLLRWIVSAFSELIALKAIDRNALGHLPLPIKTQTKETFTLREFSLLLTQWQESRTGHWLENHKEFFISFFNEDDLAFLDQVPKWIEAVNSYSLYLQIPSIDPRLKAECDYASPYRSDLTAFFSLRDRLCDNLHNSPFIPEEDHPYRIQNTEQQTELLCSPLHKITNAVRKILHSLRLLSVIYRINQIGGSALNHAISRIDLGLDGPVKAIVHSARLIIRVIEEPSDPYLEEQFTQVNALIDRVLIKVLKQELDSAMHHVRSNSNQPPPPAAKLESSKLKALKIFIYLVKWCWKNRAVNEESISLLLFGDAGPVKRGLMKAVIGSLLVQQGFISNFKSDSLLKNLYRSEDISHHLRPILVRVASLDREAFKALTEQLMETIEQTIEQALNNKALFIQFLDCFTLFGEAKPNWAELLDFWDVRQARIDDSHQTEIDLWPILHAELSHLIFSAQNEPTSNFI